MNRQSVLIVTFLALIGCKEEPSALPPPVAMTAASTGHYCQMELLEHPGPKAQAHLAGLDHPLFFSQVRDVVAYQRMPEQSHVVTVAYVSDMGAEGAHWDDPGATNWVESTLAHYVVGSSVAGGMGAPELVPFARAEHARAFAARHGGEVLRLHEIPDSAVLAPVDLDERGSEADEGEFQRRLRALTADEEIER